MKIEDVESIAFDVVDCFDEQEIRKLIEAVEESPSTFVAVLEILLADL